MRKILLSVSLVMLLGNFANADEAKKVSLTQQEKQEMVNSEFEMPSPGALVNALTKKLGNVKWSDYTLPVTKKKYPSIEDKVLNLGLRGAEAYYLTVAKDSANLISVSTEINYLLNKIKVNGKSLNNHARKKQLDDIRSLVKAGKWKDVLKEINKLQNSIDRDFLDAKSKNLMLLNNVGGWLEGYRLAVEGIKNTYKAEATELIMQKELIDYLIKELQNNQQLKGNDKTQKILNTLSSINKVLSGAKDNQLSKAQIEELSKILANIKTYI